MLIAYSLKLFIIFSLFNNIVLADSVDDYFRTAMRESHIPGLQVAIVKNDRILKVASYGLANVQDDVKVDDTTVFNLASITKAFTSVAVMQLVEQGVLKLSSPISAYLSELPETWRKVTLKQVMSHTSGLPDIMNKKFQLIDSEGEEESWLQVKKKALYFEPGTAFHYNQTNYLIVGKIIKQVTGKSYAELIREYQLKSKKLSLTNKAGFSHFQSVNLHQARDYRLNQKKELTNVLTYFPSIIRAGAGMSSNATELAHWTQQLQKGEFFKNDSSLDVLWEKSTLTSDDWARENPSMHPYALGWYVVESSKGTKIVTAGGGQSAVAVYPELNLSIVILSNLAGAKPEDLMDEIAEFYIDDFGLPAEVKVLKLELERRGYNNGFSIVKKIQQEQKFKFSANDLNHFGNLLVKHSKHKKASQIFTLNNRLHSKVILEEHDLDNYVGTYALENFSIDVTHESKALFITATGDERLPIFSKTKTEFYLSSVDATISFIKGKTGVVTGLLLGINGENLLGKKSS